MSELKKQPWVYFTRGVPSSGKSFVVDKITDLYKVAVISKDTIREQLYPKWHYDHLQYHHLIVVGDGRDALFDVAYRNNMSIILDETFIEMTDFLYMYTKVQFPYKPALIDLTWVSKEQLMENDAKRKEPRGEELIDKYLFTLQSHPTSSIMDMFDHVVGQKELEFWIER